MSDCIDITLEAKILGRYLTGRSINEFSVDQYIKASEYFPELTVSEKKLYSFMLRNPFFIGWIDGGICLAKSHYGLRKRFVFMLGILECQTEYCQIFISQKMRFFDWFKMVFYALRGVFRGIAGYILVKMVSVGKNV